MRLTLVTCALSLLPALALVGPAQAGEALPRSASSQPAPDQASARPARHAAAGAGAKDRVQAAPAKARAASPASARAEAGATPAPPLSPRWVAPRVEMKGLVVWVFTPGHFQRD